MQVALSPAAGQTTLSAPSGSPKPGVDSSANAQAPRDEPAAAQAPVHGESATVSIAGIKPAAEPIPAAAYAEIWKNGVKIARIDANGRVSGEAGVVATDFGGLSGPLVAAQRAVRIAQLVGGEIRNAGQSVDGTTLMMRARLAELYRSPN